MDLTKPSHGAFLELSRTLNAPARENPPLPLVYLELDRAFQNSRRPLTAHQSPYYQPVDTRPTFDELEPKRIRAAWRIVRYILAALGRGEAYDPVGFVLSDPELQILRRDPFFPVSRTKQIRASVGTMPGLRAFEDIIRETPLVPPEPIPGNQQIEACATAYSLAAEALGLDRQTASDENQGLIGLTPEATGTDNFDEFLKVFYHRAPSLDEIILFEQSFLTQLARSLMEANEDDLRSYLRAELCATDFEAYSITQTAKHWAAALRPINLETERVMALRTLEAVRDRALRLNDLQAAISASREIARIVGLHETPAAGAKEQQFRDFDRHVEALQEALEMREAAIEGAVGPKKQLEPPGKGKIWLNGGKNGHSNGSNGHDSEEEWPPKPPQPTIHQMVD